MRTRTLRRLVGGVLAAPLAALVPAAGADAATVTVRSLDAGDLEVQYVAAPGEINDVLVAKLGRSRLRITDAGAVITPTGRCRPLDSHSALCRSRLLYRAQVALGDLDDRVRTTEPTDDVELAANGGAGNDELRGAAGAVVLSGGDGDDRIYGGAEVIRRLYGGYCCSTLNGGAGQDKLYAGRASEDELNGGAGDDQLYGDNGSNGVTLDGGGGQDELYGGPGDDWLTDGDRDDAAGTAAPGPDTLDAGGGEDTLSYDQRTQAVSVESGTDLDAGKVGERDSAIAIESIVGGRGNARLVGDHRDNVLDGGGGADLLIGRGGFDRLYGGAGRDRVLGGRGSDELSGGSGVDGLSCGAGDDLLESERRRLREVVPRSCERLVFFWPGSSGNAVFLRPHPRRTQPSWLALHMECPAPYDEGYVGCRGTVSVREGQGRRRLLAHGSFRHGADGARFGVPLALTCGGRRWWAGELGRAPATVALRMIAEATPSRPFTWRITAPGSQ